MLQSALRADALRSTSGGFELRIGLPWIRSMPLACLRELAVRIDGEPVPVRVLVGGREVVPAALLDHPGWWFLQDRLVLAGDHELSPGAHAVSVEFRLLVPYLQAGPGTPLVLPFSLQAELVLDAPALPTVSRDVA